MTRTFAATLILSSVAFAAPPDPVPTPMPAPSFKPTATMPASTMATPITETIDAECASCEGSRCGIFRRIASHWGTQTYSTLPPGACCDTTQFGNYCPKIVSYQHVEMKCGNERGCCGFGLGRFFGLGCRERTVREKPCREERVGLWSRIKARITPKCLLSKCDPIPTPYHAPARYYFGPGGEPATGCGQCLGPVCSGLDNGCLSTHCGGRPGCGVGGGLALGARLHDRPGLVQRIDDMHTSCREANGRLRSDAGGALLTKHCQNNPGCWDLKGTPLTGEVRFATDKRPTPPNINAGRPYDYTGSWHDLQYMKGEKPAENVTAAK